MICLGKWYVTRLFDNDMFRKVVQMVHPPFMTSKLGFSPSSRRNTHLSIFYYYIFQRINNLVPSFFFIFPIEKNETLLQNGYTLSSDNPKKI
jgi:hypothetical protein